MKREIKILLYGAAFWYLAEGMFGPLLAVFTQKIGGNILDISLAWSIYLIFMGLLSIVIGRISDRISKEKIMVVGYILNTLFTFGYIFVSTSMQLFFIQAGLGIAAALATPTWNALYGHHSRRKEEGNNWGIANGSTEIITGLAIVLGGVIVKFTSFDILFIIMGCIQLIGTIAQAEILREDES